MFHNVIAQIITFNPDIELLEKNIRAIVSQVDKLFVFDNNSDNINEVEFLCGNLSVELKKNKMNAGIAGGLYEGVLTAKKNNYKYILTLDQDSVCEDNIVHKLKTTLEYNMAAMVGPAIFDDRVSLRKSRVKNNVPDFEIEHVITSGALADVEKLVEVGNYSKEMFIDWVDIEICRRLKVNGYKIFKSTDAVLTHHMGNPQSVKILFKKITPLNYSPFRLYYQARNIKFCYLKYKNKEWYKQDRKFLRKSYLRILLAEKNKFAKINALKKGKKDAKKFYLDTVKGESK